MQVVLVMFRSDGERRSFSVVRNMTIIGRREDCDLRIPVGEVSRKHCRLVMTDDGIRIEDLGSSNGTWVNGERVQESDLNPGDTVIVGPVQFIVQINGVPAEDEMTAPAPPVADEEDSMMGHQSPTAPAATADSGEFTIDQEAAASADAPEEFQIEEEPAVAAEAPAEEFAIEEAPAPAATLPAAEADEFAFEEEPAAEPAAIEEFALEEEPVAKAEPVAETPVVAETEAEDELELPAFPAPAAAAGEDEFEMPDLDAEVDATTPAPAAGVGDSEWDFVIEESAGDEAAGDFNIDLDSPHEQPRK